MSASQELSWPRNYVDTPFGSGYLPSNTIPKNLKNAVCEAAVLEMLTPGILLTPSMTREASKSISSVSKSVDVISKSVTYERGTEKEKAARFERLNAWLENLVRAKTNRVYRG